MYLDNDNFDLDPCYSSGKFYEDLERPKIKMDKEPKSDNIEQNDILNGFPLINDNSLIIIKEKQYIERWPHENFPWYYQNTSGTVDMDNKMLCTAENSSQTEFNIEIE